MKNAEIISELGTQIYSVGERIQSIAGSSMRMERISRSDDFINFFNSVGSRIPAEDIGNVFDRNLKESLEEEVENLKNLVILLTKTVDGKDSALNEDGDGGVFSGGELTDEIKPPEEKKEDEADTEKSVGVIVLSEGKILTGTRNNDFGKGLICGPGGHVKVGETCEEAAARETKKEFGIDVNELIPIGVGPEEDNGLKACIFLCTDYSGVPACLSDEMVRPQFLSLEEIKNKSDALFEPFANSLILLEKELFPFKENETGSGDLEDENQSDDENVPSQNDG